MVKGVNGNKSQRSLYDNDKPSVSNTMIIINPKLKSEIQAENPSSNHKSRFPNVHDIDVDTKRISEEMFVRGQSSWTKNYSNMNSKKEIKPFINNKPYKNFVI